jgi:hypothetical protein
LQNRFGTASSVTKQTYGAKYSGKFEKKIALALMAECLEVEKKVF